MNLEGLEKRYLSSDGTNPQGWGTKVWILDSDLAKLIRVAKAAIQLERSESNKWSAGMTQEECELCDAIAEMIH